MKVLVLNCGSSSLKFQVIEPEPEGSVKAGRRWARGLVERIGGDARWRFEGAAREAVEGRGFVRDHREAVEKVGDWLSAAAKADGPGFDAVGHRIVHGADRFTSATLIDDEVLRALEEVSELAPLHNPPGMAAVAACRNRWGSDLPMVAVFDTAFHRTLPEHAFTYALPHELAARHRIRRYGFHGLAFRFVLERYREIAACPAERTDLVAFHLGNGCSVTAVRAGASVDTSMGFTPLEGLVMGTRSGDLDAGIVSYLARREGVAAETIEEWLNERSGLLGLSGVSNDMRVIAERCAGDARAQLAFEVFCYRARKYLGAYLAVLGGASAVLFSGGIGENQPAVRSRICAEMDWCGLRLDEEKNARAVGAEAKISDDRSRMEVYVIPADEELLIARETLSVLQGRRDDASGG